MNIGAQQPCHVFFMGESQELHSGNSFTYCITTSKQLQSVNPSSTVLKFLFSTIFLCRRIFPSLSFLTNYITRSFSFLLLLIIII